MNLKAIIDGIDARFGIWRVFILAFALLFFVAGGISIFHVPAYETIYDRQMLTVAHADGARTVMCTLDIGNTGKQSQSVEIHFKSEPLQNIMLPVKARNYGVKDRALQSRDAGDTTIFTIEDLEAEKQVEVRFVLRVPADAPLPAWEDLLIMIKPEQGRALTGSPGMIKLLRFLYLFL